MMSTSEDCAETSLNLHLSNLFPLIMNSSEEDKRKAMKKKYEKQLLAPLNTRIDKLEKMIID
jgi:hypothetical protein